MQLDRLVAQLPSLFEFLNQAGFQVTMKSRLDVHDLLLNLSIQNEQELDVALIRRMTGPVVCKSPEEQGRFESLFDQWEQQFSEVASVAESNVPKADVRKVDTNSKSDVVKRLILAGCIIAVFGFFVFAKLNPGLLAEAPPIEVVEPDPDPDTASADPPPIEGPTNDDLPIPDVDVDGFDEQETGELEGDKTEPEPATAETAQDDDIEKQVATRPDYLKAVWASGSCMLLFAVGIVLWWAFSAHLRKRFLNKLSVDWEPDVDKLAVQCETINRTHRRIRSTARRLRERVVSASQHLNMHQTAVQTAKNAGLFSPVQAKHKVSPSYLVLIQRDGRDDQQTQMVDDLVNQLVSEDLDVTRYYYQSDPRICRKRGGASFHLNDLAASHSLDRLLVFGEANAFLNPIDGTKASWLRSFDVWDNRALLVSSEQKDWSAAESALSEDFVVSSASQDGLASLIEGFEPDPALMPEIGNDRYPAMLRIHPERWLEREAPEPYELDSLLAQVRNYLGDEGYQWLSSCAVYPSLHHRLTLWVGDGMKDENGNPLVTDSDLMRLARLPWMRQGRLPDWLRARLITDLTPEQEESIRSRLHDLLTTAGADHKTNMALPIVNGTAEGSTVQRKKRGRQIRQDHTFVSFWSNPLSVRLPRAINSLLPTSGNWSITRALAASAMFVCFFASFAAVLPRQEIDVDRIRWIPVRIAIPYVKPSWESLAKPDYLNGDALIEFTEVDLSNDDFGNIDYVITYENESQTGAMEVREGHIFANRNHKGGFARFVENEVAYLAVKRNFKVFANEVEDNCESDLDVLVGLQRLPSPHAYSTQSQSISELPSPGLALAKIAVGEYFSIRVAGRVFKQLKGFLLLEEDDGQFTCATDEDWEVRSADGLQTAEFRFQAAKPIGQDTAHILVFEESCEVVPQGDMIGPRELARLKQYVEDAPVDESGKRQLQGVTMRTIKWETVERSESSEPQNQAAIEDLEQTALPSEMEAQQSIEQSEDQNDLETSEQEIEDLLRRVEEAKLINLSAAISIAKRAHKRSIATLGFEDELTISTAEVLVDLYFMVEDYSSSVPILREMIEHLKDDDLLAGMHVIIGGAYKATAQYTKSLASFSIARRFMDASDPDAGIVEFNIGDSHRIVAEFGRAESILLGALDQLERNGPSEMALQCRHSLALLYFEVDSFERAIEVMKLPKPGNDDEFKRSLREIRDSIQTSSRNLNSYPISWSTLGEDAERVIGKLLTARSEGVGTSSQVLGGNIIQRAYELDLKDLEVQADGDVIRITIPADELFRKGTSERVSQAESVIAPVVAQIRRVYPRQRVGIEGHTDDSLAGSQAHQVAEAQAAEVLGLLTGADGLPIEQVFMLAHGANHPRVSNASEAGRAKNRRIEIVVYPETFQPNPERQSTPVEITQEVMDAAPDLSISIRDPRAPAPVGAEVVYEIAIKNQGGKAATDVQAVAQFSHGIEPIRVEGYEARIETGQAIVAIKSIQPNQEVRLQVFAKAEKAGQHFFRAAVESGEIRLASEETTKFVEVKAPSNSTPAFKKLQKLNVLIISPEEDSDLNQIRELHTTFKLYGSSVFERVEVRSIEQDEADYQGIVQGMKWMSDRATKESVEVVYFTGRGERTVPESEDMNLSLGIVQLRVPKPTFPKSEPRLRIFASSTDDSSIPLEYLTGLFGKKGGLLMLDVVGTTLSKTKSGERYTFMLTPDDVNSTTAVISSSSNGIPYIKDDGGFTKMLSFALKYADHDGSKDGVNDLGEIKDYLAAEVARSSDGKQTLFESIPNKRFLDTPISGPRRAPGIAENMILEALGF